MNQCKYVLEQYIILLEEQGLIRYVRSEEEALKQEVGYLSYDS